MRLWQTFSWAVTLGAFLFGCEGSKTAKKTTDDDDEQDTKPATAQSTSPSTSAASTAIAPTSSAPAVASEEATKDDDAPPGTPADAVLLDDGKRVIALSVKPDGATSLLAFQSGEKGSSLVPIEAEKISGKVRADEGEWLDLASGKDGATAKLPKLESGLTVVQLALEIAGEAFEESIDVPEGGTASLTDRKSVV